MTDNQRPNPFSANRAALGLARLAYMALDLAITAALVIGAAAAINVITQAHP